MAEFGTFSTTGDRGHDEFLRRLQQRIEALERGTVHQVVQQQVVNAPANVSGTVEVKESDGDPDLFVTGIECDQTDITVTQNGDFAKLNLAATAVTPGAYGDAGHIPVVTFDSKGRATAASQVAVSSGVTGGHWRVIS